MATATASGSGTSKGETIKSKKLLDRVSESLIFKTYYVSESQRKQHVGIDLGLDSNRDYCCQSWYVTYVNRCSSFNSYCSEYSDLEI